MKNKFSKSVYIFSAVIPAVILYISLYINGINFGSEKTILISDLGAQYAPFLSFLSKMGSGFNNIMYQSLSGLGGSFFGTWAYYLADPISLIVLLFDAYHLPDAIYLIILVKIALCGLTMSIYLKKGYLRISNTFIVVILSVSYALMTYNMMYMILPMWLNGVMMLPLVILGMDRIIEKKSSALFIVSFAASVMLNYYTAFMIAFFAVIYFLYRICSEKTELKSVLNTFLTLAGSSVLAVMLSAWLWLPVFIDFGRGKLAEGDKHIDLFIRNVLNVSRQLLPFAYDGVIPSDSPAVYCGILCSALLVSGLFMKKFSIRKKVTVICVCAFYYFSFCIGYLDVLWHGLKIPNCFPARYSFTFTFFMIILSAELLGHIFETIRNKAKNENISVYVYLVLTFITCFDLYINSSYVVSRVESDKDIGKRFNRYDYEVMVSISELIKEYAIDSGKILYSNYEYSSNDGLLFGVPTLDYFSSSYNLGLSSFIRNLGVDYVFNIEDDEGLNAANANVLGVGYAADFKNSFPETEMSGYMTPVWGDDSFRIYKLNNCFEYGFSVPYYDSSSEFNYDPFYNINLLYSDITSVNGIFEECEIESLKNFDDPSFAFTEELIVTPQAGRHLYFYVSPRDYYENHFSCNDELYLGDELIAKFVEVGFRYIVDLGYSDGTTLTFKFSSGYPESEVFFYTMDPEAFENAVSSVTPVFSEVKPSYDGISGNITLERESEVVFLIPYENGFTVRIDGSKVPYTAYRGGLVMISVPAGTHEYSISYVVPGLAAGSAISVIGIAVLILYLYMKRKKLNS